MRDWGIGEGIRDLGAKADVAPVRDLHRPSFLTLFEGLDGNCWSTSLFLTMAKARLGHGCRFEPIGFRL